MGQINDNEYRWGEWRGVRKKTQKNVREPYAHSDRYACVYICTARTLPPLLVKENARLRARRIDFEKLIKSLCFVEYSHASEVAGSSSVQFDTSVVIFVKKRKKVAITNRRHRGM